LIWTSKFKFSFRGLIPLHSSSHYKLLSGLCCEQHDTTTASFVLHQLYCNQV